MEPAGADSSSSNPFLTDEGPGSQVGHLQGRQSQYCGSLAPSWWCELFPEDTQSLVEADKEDRDITTHLDTDACLMQGCPVIEGVQ